MIAFVLGNGTSRVSIDITLLKQHGTIYGCNAIYRDFLPDVLISVDYRMIVELIENKVDKCTTVWANKQNRPLPESDINFFQNSLGWSSGPTALNLSCEQGATEVYILGFDYQGVNNHTKFNNVYADSKNYKKSSDAPTFYGNWLSQTEIVFKKFPNVTFYYVHAPNAWLPEWDFFNVHHLTVDIFNEKIKNRSF